MKRLYFRTVLHLNKNQADNTEVLFAPVPLHTVSSIINIISISVVHFLELMNQYWYIIINWSP